MGSMRINSTGGTAASVTCSKPDTRRCSSTAMRIWSSSAATSLNPVRAGIVRCAAAYRWSSARAYVGAHTAAPFLTVAEVLGHFGRSPRRAQTRYREFLRDAEDGRVQASPLDDVVAQTLLGGPEWVGHM